jgi:phosphoglycolate phosphatase
MDEYEERKFSAGIFDGAEKVLRYIKSNGIGQSILSAYKHDTLIKIVAHYDLFHFFDNVCGLDNIYASSKVYLGIKLMSKLQLHKHEVVFIGDTLHDLEVAKSIGADCILIANGHQSKEALTKSNILVVDDISKLL